MNCRGYHVRATASNRFPDPPGAPIVDDKKPLLCVSMDDCFGHDKWRIAALPLNYAQLEMICIKVDSKLKFSHLCTLNLALHHIQWNLTWIIRMKGVAQLIGLFQHWIFYSCSGKQWWCVITWAVASRTEGTARVSVGVGHGRRWYTFDLLSAFRHSRHSFFVHCKPINARKIIRFAFHLTNRHRFDAVKCIRMEK